MKFVAILLITVCFAAITLVIVLACASHYVTSASRYQSRSSMYIRGLIPRNSTELAEKVRLVDLTCPLDPCRQHFTWRDSDKWSSLTLKHTVIHPLRKRFIYKSLNSTISRYVVLTRISRHEMHIIYAFVRCIACDHLSDWLKCATNSVSSTDVDKS